MPTAFAAALLAATLAAPAPADDPGEGWRPLFDGKSLDGWKHVGPGRFVVEPDGTLRTEGGMGLLWYTKETFGDCVLRVVYKTTARSSNSGVFIRVDGEPADEWRAVHKGFEVQICDGADAFHRTGAVYSMSRATASPGKVGQWNTMEITLDGPRIAIAINGEPVQDFNPDTDPIPPREKDYEPERGPRPHKGYIGLQNHDDAGNDQHVYFKDVSVRPLKR